jgi:hypothetical protein
MLATDMVLGEAVLTRVDRRIALSLRAVVPAMIVAAFLWRIFGRVDPADRFFDDFFYYLRPAQNWVGGAGSTFFPGELTNGYHPLWFLWLALLYWITGGGTIFFGLVDLSLMGLMVGFFFLFERFLQRVTGQRLAAAVGASVATLAITPKAMLGLEMALTVFAAALLLDYLSRKPLVDQTVRDAAVVGLLGAFLVLSRLDAVMLAPGLLVAVFPRWGWKRLAAVAVGATPVYLYLAFNLAVYGHLGTTSMTAKSLAFYWPPNWHFISVEAPARQVVEIGLVLLAVATAVLLRSSENVDGRRVALALTAAPVLQFAAQALMSGWRLYPWYVYFDFMVLGLTTALLVAQLRGTGVSGRVGIAVGAAALVIASFWFVAGIKPEKEQVAMAYTARRLKSFSVDHPGVYAMGDAAGTPTWMMNQPVVHLEGLMMSHAFLDRIRQGQPLEQVFRDYHVNYYLAVRPTGTDGNGCLHFVEPSPRQASPRAPGMAMTICKPPIEVIDWIGPGRGVAVRIYKVDPATGRVD